MTWFISLCQVYPSIPKGFVANIHFRLNSCLDIYQFSVHSTNSYLSYAIISDISLGNLGTNFLIIKFYLELVTDCLFMKHCKSKVNINAICNFNNCL